MQLPTGGQFHLLRHHRAAATDMQRRLAVFNHLQNIIDRVRVAAVVKRILDELPNR